MRRGKGEKAKRKLKTRRGWRFVSGVAAGICRLPHDRPKSRDASAETSMNVYLVNSKAMEFWRFVFLSLRTFHVFRTHTRRESHGHETVALFEFFSLFRLSRRPPNFTRSNPKIPEN